MPSDNDLLCGKIAVELGFCTEGQVDRCLQIQASSRAPMPLGRHLIEEAVLTEDQHSKVLEVQRRRMHRFDPVVNSSKEEALFGTLAVKEGWVTREDLNACLRVQGKPGEKRSLGEILVAEGLLTNGQVKALLGKQSKKIMSCEGCKVSFTVHTISLNKEVPCPRCKKPLKDGKPSDSTRTDADIRSDSVMKSREELLGAARPPSSGRCRICDHPFTGKPGSDGRVECLSCHVRFVP